MTHNHVARPGLEVAHAAEASDDAAWLVISSVAAVMALAHVLATVLWHQPFGTEPTLALVCALGFVLSASDAAWRVWRGFARQ